MKKQNKKLYVISSTKFNSAKEAKEQMLEWWKKGCLNRDAKVYEVSKAYEFRIVSDLKEVWRAE